MTRIISSWHPGWFFIQPSNNLQVNCTVHRRYPFPPPPPSPTISTSLVSLPASSSSSSSSSEVMWSSLSSSLSLTNFPIRRFSAREKSTGSEWVEERGRESGRENLIKLQMLSRWRKSIKDASKLGQDVPETFLRLHLGTRVSKSNFSRNWVDMWGGFVYCYLMTSWTDGGFGNWIKIQNQEVLAHFVGAKKMEETPTYRKTRMCWLFPVFAAASCASCDGSGTTFWPARRNFEKGF